LGPRKLIVLNKVRVQAGRRIRGPFSWSRMRGTRWGYRASSISAHRDSLRRRGMPDKASAVFDRFFGSPHFMWRTGWEGEFLHFGHRPFQFTPIRTQFITGFLGVPRGDVSEPHSFENTCKEGGVTRVVRGRGAIGGGRRARERLSNDNFHVVIFREGR